VDTFGEQDPWGSLPGLVGGFFSCKQLRFSFKLYWALCLTLSAHLHFRPERCSKKTRLPPMTPILSAATWPLALWNAQNHKGPVDSGEIVVSRRRSQFHQYIFLRWTEKERADCCYSFARVVVIQRPCAFGAGSVPGQTSGLAVLSCSWPFWISVSPISRSTCQPRLCCAYLASTSSKHDDSRACRYRVVGRCPMVPFFMGLWSF
jgi:hypothetical protein